MEERDHFTNWLFARNDDAYLSMRNFLERYVDNPGVECKLLRHIVDQIMPLTSFQVRYKSVDHVTAEPLIHSAVALYARTGFAYTMEKLVEFDKTVTHRLNFYGQTALHVYCENVPARGIRGLSRGIFKMIKLGFDPFALDDLGMLPIQYLEEHQRQYMFKKMMNVFDEHSEQYQTQRLKELAICCLDTKTDLFSSFIMKIMSVVVNRFEEGGNHQESSEKSNLLDFVKHCVESNKLTDGKYFKYKCETNNTWNWIVCSLINEKNWKVVDILILNGKYVDKNNSQNGIVTCVNTDAVCMCELKNYMVDKATNAVKRLRLFEAILKGGCKIQCMKCKDVKPSETFYQFINEMHKQESETRNKNPCDEEEPILHTILQLAFEINYVHLLPFTKWISEHSAQVIPEFDVEVKNSRGETLLITALYEKPSVIAYQVVKLLLEWGADTEAETVHRKNCYYIVKSLMKTDRRKMLIKNCIRNAFSDDAVTSSEEDQDVSGSGCDQDICDNKSSGTEETISWWRNDSRQSKTESKGSMTKVQILEKIISSAKARSDIITNGANDIDNFAWSNADDQESHPNSDYCKNIIHRSSDNSEATGNDISCRTDDIQTAYIEKHHGGDNVVDNLESENGVAEKTKDMEHNLSLETPGNQTISINDQEWAKNDNITSTINVESDSETDAIQTDGVKVEELEYELECTEAFLSSVQFNDYSMSFREKLKRCMYDIAENGKPKRFAAVSVETHIEYKNKTDNSLSTNALNLHCVKLTDDTYVIIEDAINFSVRCSNFDPILSEHCINSRPSVDRYIYTKVLRIWDVTVDVKKAIERVKVAHVNGITNCTYFNKLKKESSQYYTSCKENDHHLASVTLYPLSDTNESSVLKLYAVTSQLIECIVMKNKPSARFPLKLTEKEFDIINYRPKPPEAVLLLGRSGTGKTTMCVYRMWVDYLHAMSELTIENEGQDGEDGEMEHTSNEVLPLPAGEARDDDNDDDDQVESYINNRQLFITRNPVLCGEVKRLFNHLRKGNDNKTDELKETNVYRFSDVLNSQYPLFLTFNKWLTCIDGESTNTYFLHHSDGRLKFSIPGWSGQEDEEMTINDLINRSSHEKIRESRKEIKAPDTEVTYEYFRDVFFRKMKGKKAKKYHANLVWTEIISFIKGSLKSIQNESGCLSLQEYEEIGRNRAPNFTGDRRIIFVMFQIYQKHLVKSGMFDRCDVVRHIYRNLPDDIQWKHDFIYVDEVQDFTEAELSLFIKCCKNPNVLFLTGDTAQNVMQGVSFRFTDLRSLFYEAERSIVSQQPIRIPASILQLVYNYRSCDGILKMASSVLEILNFFFPESFDSLKPDQGMFSGKVPVIIKSSKGDLIKYLCHNQNKASQTDFGANQAILVANLETKNEIQSHLKAFVLTIFEAKGLEFDDVLLYNFFTDSQAGDKWRHVQMLINKLEKENKLEMAELDSQSERKYFSAVNSRDQKTPDKFDSSENRILVSELKQLYTALTRAKVNVWIFDEDEDKRKWMFNYFERRRVATIGTQADIFSVSSSKAELEKKGDYFMKECMYELALRAYTYAESEKKALAACYVHHIEARKIQSNKDRTKELCSVAFEFAEQNKSSEAIKCLIEAEEYNYAAKYCESIAQFDEAGELYEKCEMIDKAVDCYKACGQWKKAVKLLESRKKYGAALSLIRDDLPVDCESKEYREVYAWMARLYQFNYQYLESSACYKLIGDFRNACDVCYQSKMYTQALQYYDEYTDRSVTEMNLVKPVVDYPLVVRKCVIESKNNFDRVQQLIHRLQMDEKVSILTDLEMYDRCAEILIKQGEWNKGMDILFDHQLFETLLEYVKEGPSQRILWILKCAISSKSKSGECTLPVEYLDEALNLCNGIEMLKSDVILSYCKLYPTSRLLNPSLAEMLDILLDEYVQNNNICGVINCLEFLNIHDTKKRCHYLEIMETFLLSHVEAEKTDNFITKCKQYCNVKHFICHGDTVNEEFVSQPRQDFRNRLNWTDENSIFSQITEMFYKYTEDFLTELANSLIRIMEGNVYHEFAQKIEDCCCMITKSSSLLEIVTKWNDSKKLQTTFFEVCDHLYQLLFPESGRYHLFLPQVSTIKLRDIVQNSNCLQSNIFKKWLDKKWPNDKNLYTKTDDFICVLMTDRLESGQYATIENTLTEMSTSVASDENNSKNENIDFGIVQDKFTKKYANVVQWYLDYMKHVHSRQPDIFGAIYQITRFSKYIIHPSRKQLWASWANNLMIFEQAFFLNAIFVLVDDPNQVVYVPGRIYHEMEWFHCMGRNTVIGYFKKCIGQKTDTESRVMRACKHINSLVETYLSTQSGIISVYRQHDILERNFVLFLFIFSNNLLFPTINLNEIINMWKSINYRYKELQPFISLLDVNSTRDCFVDVLIRLLHTRDNDRLIQLFVFEDEVRCVVVNQ